MSYRTNKINTMKLTQLEFDVGMAHNTAVILVPAAETRKPTRLELMCTVSPMLFRTRLRTKSNFDTVFYAPSQKPVHFDSLRNWILANKNQRA